MDRRTRPRLGALSEIETATNQVLRKQMDNITPIRRTEVETRKTLEDQVRRYRKATVEFKALTHAMQFADTKTLIDAGATLGKYTIEIQNLEAEIDKLLETLESAQ